MVCRIRKLNGLEQYGMKWNEWNGLPKHEVHVAKFDELKSFDV